VTYDPVTYWHERGETYMATFRPERYTEQEEALVALLGRLEFSSVLEVGCGFGRIASLIRRVKPQAAYVGLDLSPTMLAAARKRLGTDAALIESSLADHKTTARWDMVIAVELLMHIPPSGVVAAVRKLDRLADRHIVTLDWTAPIRGKRPAAHNFLHPYVELLGAGPFGRPRQVEVIPVGLQAIHHVAKR
jgi:trans-aconitate methyltransferase